MTEEWRPTHHPDYDVSNLGRVRSRMISRSPRLLTIHPDRGGYLRVRIAGQTCRVHRLVTAAFIGPCPERQECMHLDDDKMNVALSNLEYGTHLQNIRTCVLRNRRVYHKGERNGQSKLTESQVKDIRVLRNWMFLRELAIIFNAGISTVHRASSGKTWQHVE